MRFLSKLYFLLFMAAGAAVSFIGGGCAQIGMPTGGPKDTLAPKVIRASPENGSRNFSGNSITLAFDEYIDVQDLQQNLLVSPLQNRTPVIIIGSRSINVKFRDSLLPNTTYTINFGNAVRDINENNVYKGLTYAFSTGNNLDSLTLEGNVFLAETGLADSTLLIMLYRNQTDTIVLKKKPDYIARVNGTGGFHFDNLPKVPFKIYALRDGDGGKTYNSLAETFAFTEGAVTPGSNEEVLLYAYAQEKEKDPKTTSSVKPVTDKRLRLSTPAQGGQDLLSPLEIDLNNPLALADSNHIIVADTFYRKIAGSKFSTDSTAKKIRITVPWQAATNYILLTDKDALKDSAGVTLLKSDTLHFTTKRNEDYGKLTLRFSNLDLKANPVLQFLSNNTLKYSYRLSAAEWSNVMFTPGDYGIRILYDTNGDGVWTPGNYSKKLQPEISVTLPQTLGVRADWDNEREINL